MYLTFPPILYAHQLDLARVVICDVVQRDTATDGKTLDCKLGEKTKVKSLSGMTRRRKTRRQDQKTAIGGIESVLRDSESAATAVQSVPGVVNKRPWAPARLRD